MGKTLIILLAYTISNVFLFSCKDESQGRQIISQAEKLVVLYPDSALLILDSISFPEEMSRPLAAKWSLLYARSADKVGKHLPYVYQLELSVGYYRSERRFSELAEAGFYLARSYVEDKDYDKAMQAYVDALSVALEIKDYDRAGYICSYMADLYDIDGSYVKAAKKYEEGNLYFKEAGNQKSYAFGLVNAAFEHSLVRDYEKAISLLLEADSLSMNLSDRTVIAYVQNWLGNVYNELGKYDLAELCILKAIELDSTNILSNYTSLIDIYYHKRDKCKFSFYLNEMQRFTDLSPGIHHILYEDAKLDGAYKDALFYLEQYMHVADSVDKAQKDINMLDIEEKYRHSLLRNENNQLKIDRQYHYIGLFFLLLVLFLLIIVYLLMMRKKNDYIFKQQDLINQQDEKIYLVMMDLQQKKEELHKQSLRIEETRKLLHVQGSLDEEMLKCNLLKENIKSLNEELIKLRTDKLLQSTVAKKLQKMSQSLTPNTVQSQITDRYWKTIEEQVLSVYPALLNLMQSAGLTLTECRFCYLTLFKLDTTEIAILLNIIPDSVVKQRLRVRQKLGLAGKNIDLYQCLVMC